MIHSTADVQTKKIGMGTIIWQFVVILKNASIGSNCNINAHVFIENEVIVGDNVTIKSGVQLWDGVTLENNVFIGPNVTFTNDILPRSKQYPDSFKKTHIHKGASLGANSTIIAGNSIGEYAMTGAGAVVTRSIGKNELWIGNPARKSGYITNTGILLNLDLIAKDSNEQYCWNNNDLERKDD